jgi:hypothetical protein
MKTIEERASEYAHKYRREVRDLSGERADAAFAGFIAGAESERNELLQWDDQSEANDVNRQQGISSRMGRFREYLFKWRDPKVELPDTDVEVLVMVHADGHTYDVMRYDKCGWWQKAPGGGWCAPNNAPIGWRYIHEL